MRHRHATFPRRMRRPGGAKGHGKVRGRSFWALEWVADGADGRRRRWRYELVERVGDGAYGHVWKARNRNTRKWMAIKVMKNRYASHEEAMAEPELVALRKLRHPNVVRLLDAVFETDGRGLGGELWLVMEYLDMNLLDYLQRRKGNHLPIPVVQNIARKLLQALAELHRTGLVHRDLKPENVLVDPKENTIKLADFGLARMATRRAPMTGYVATRWYRAPEILLQMDHYGPQADMFSVGCIVAEMLLLEPLFPGKTELDQISEICRVLGPLTEGKWPEGANKLSRMGFQATVAAGDAKGMPNMSVSAKSLVVTLCSWDPQRRATAAQALQHPFLAKPVAKARKSSFQKECLSVLKDRGQPTLTRGTSEQGRVNLQIRALPLYPRTVQYGEESSAMGTNDLLKTS